MDSFNASILFETPPIIYLEAGQTYTFSGTFDDSAGIFFGAGANVKDASSGNTVTAPYDGAWFKGYGTTSKFVVTVPEDGYYDFSFVTHNQSGEGRYDLTLNDVDLNAENFTLFPTADSLIAAAQADANSDKIRIEYYTDAKTGTGHYKLFNANEGVVGKDVPLATIDAALTDTDGSETLTVTLSSIPAGVTLTDGKNTIISDGTTPIDVTDWDLKNLKVNSATAQDFVIDVAVTSTEKSNLDAKTATGTINVSIEADDGQGEVVYPFPSISNVSDVTATEGADLVHTVQLSGATTQATEYSFKLGGASDSATADDYGTPSFSNGVTYDAATETITVPKGVTSFTVTYTATTDSEVEGTENVTLEVGGVTGQGEITDVVAPTSGLTIHVEAKSNSYSQDGDLTSFNKWGGTNGTWKVTGDTNVFTDNNGANAGLIGIQGDAWSTNNGDPTVYQLITDPIPANALIALNIGWNNGYWGTTESGKAVSGTISYNNVALIKMTTSAENGRSDSPANAIDTVGTVSGMGKVEILHKDVVLTINGVTYKYGDSIDWKTWSTYYSDGDKRTNGHFLIENGVLDKFLITIPTDAQTPTAEGNKLAIVYDKAGETDANAGRDDIQISSFEIVNAPADRDVIVPAGTTDNILEYVNISSTTNIDGLKSAVVKIDSGYAVGDDLTVDLASVKLNTTGATLANYFETAFNNGTLTITAKDGSESIEYWNTLLQAIKLTSVDGAQKDISFQVTDDQGNVSNNQTVSIKSGVSASFAMFSLENNDIIFDLLNDDNTGGNTLTTVNDFTATDHIDISDLFDNNANFENLSEYLTVSYDADADQAVISIDRDGKATQYQSAELLVLNNQMTDLTLEELLQNNQIII
ncbi:type I secretion C-terminal target domain-containing protein [Acinetobacter sp. CFCC 10889]|uniref:type I secretion C-terminal target domain-containing protein n=1 Tax=Acinetobacter sp. CFCC 10889 TaxID=1775557 RepID=UPI000DD0C882|nr:type I secretion C-terminal target domain-containing protein [Acinetobacter sp. CFCC 10889]